MPRKSLSSWVGNVTPAIIGSNSCTCCEIRSRDGTVGTETRMLIQIASAGPHQYGASSLKVFRKLRGADSLVTGWRVEMDQRLTEATKTFSRTSPEFRSHSKFRTVRAVASKTLRPAAMTGLCLLLLGGSVTREADPLKMGD